MKPVPGPRASFGLGFFVVVIGGELRARAEKALLERAFGEPYLEYRLRTRRFIPGVY